MTETITCKYCGNQYSAKMRQCPFCSGVNKRVEDEEGLILDCPGCGTNMTQRDILGERVDYCPACSGLWLSSIQFDKLTSFRNVIKDDSLPDEYIHKHGKEGIYHNCPVCKDLMPRTNFRKISGVVIDICRDHGIWLDSGELEQIRTFIANGGIDAVQDRDMALSEEEIKSLKTRTRDLEFMMEVLHTWNLKKWIFKNLWR